MKTITKLYNSTNLAYSSNSSTNSEPRLAASAARQPANDVSPLQNQRSADCSCGSANSQSPCVRVSHATNAKQVRFNHYKAKLDPQAVNAKHNCISITLTNGRRLKLRTDIRK